MQRYLRITGLLIFSLLATIAVSRPVAADMITVSDVEDQFMVTTGLAQPHEFDLSLFDSNLGTLQRVIVELEAGASIETRHFVNPGFFSPNPIPTIPEAEIVQTATYDLGLPTGGISLTGTGIATRPELSASHLSDKATASIPIFFFQEFTDSGELAMFSTAGGGLLTLSALRTLVPNSDDGEPGTVDAFEFENPRNAFLESTVWITYEYSTEEPEVTAAPEPSSFALLGVAFAGLAMRATRRRRQT